MFGLNKDTMILVAVFIALVTCFYLFNENKRNKIELASVKSLVNKPQPQPIPKPVKRKPEPEPEPEPESED